MFCTSCGAQVPDGAKFCTNCGVRLEPADNAPVFSEPASDVFSPVPETQSPYTAAPSLSGGYSVPGGGYIVPPSDAASGGSAAPRKSRAALWIVLGAIAVVLAALILLGFYILRHSSAEEDRAIEDTFTEAGIDDIDDEIDNILKDIDLPDTLPDFEDESDGDIDDAATTVDDAAMTVDECVDYFDAYFTDLFRDDPTIGWSFEIDRDYDDMGSDWIDVYFWEDGILEWANAVYSGEQEPDGWNEELEGIRYLSEQMRAYLDENGQEDTVACTNLIEEEDAEYILSFAVDGELIYDEVTGLDLWGLLEDE